MQKKKSVCAGLTEGGRIIFGVLVLVLIWLCEY